MGRGWSFQKLNLHLIVLHKRNVNSILIMLLEDLIGADNLPFYKLNFNINIK